MFANRLTAFIDACTLASVLRRNLLLTLAEADFFRIRWSAEVLDETERAIAAIIGRTDPSKAGSIARDQRRRMEIAFEEAMVHDYGTFIALGNELPDAGDRHVVAAAAKAQASIIVTENIADFPPAILETLNLEVKTADAFVADAVALDPGKAVAAIRRMRERFRRPDMSAEDLLLKMEAAGLVETVDGLRSHVGSL